MLPTLSSPRRGRRITCARSPRRPIPSVHGSTLAFAAISIGFAAASLNPTLEVEQSDSIIYFGQIAKRMHPQATREEAKRIREEFNHDFTELVSSPHAAAREVADQVWANSRIAWTKYRRVGQSSRWFFATLAVSVVFVFLSMIAPG